MARGRNRSNDSERLDEIIKLQSKSREKELVDHIAQMGRVLSDLDQQLKQQTNEIKILQAIHIKSPSQTNLDQIFQLSNDRAITKNKLDSLVREQFSAQTELNNFRKNPMESIRNPKLPAEEQKEQQAVSDINDSARSKFSRFKEAVQSVREIVAGSKADKEITLDDLPRKSPGK